MLKLAKYEFIKSKNALIIIAVIFALFEGTFLYGIFSKDDAFTGGSIVLLSFYSVSCFFIVFALAIINYSKELNSKSSYLIFMTPNSPLKIIFSKILSTLIIGCAIVAVITILAVIDITIMFEEFSSLNRWKEFFEVIFKEMGVNTALLPPIIIGYIAEFIISFFSVVTLIYMAITLSSTVLQNSKFKGYLSFILIAAFIYIMVKVEGLLPIIHKYPQNSAEVVINLIPSTIFRLIIMTGSIIGSSTLLKKKVSL